MIGQQERYQKIAAFSHDPENNDTFELWYNIYKSYFEDNSSSTEMEKVQSLLKYLSYSDRVRYTASIFPQKPENFSFAETVAKLSAIFNSDVTPFYARRERNIGDLISMQESLNQTIDISGNVISSNVNIVYQPQIIVAALLE